MAQEGARQNTRTATSPKTLEWQASTLNGARQSGRSGDAEERGSARKMEGPVYRRRAGSESCPSRPTALEGVVLRDVRQTEKDKDPVMSPVGGN